MYKSNTLKVNLSSHIMSIYKKTKEQEKSIPKVILPNYNKLFIISYFNIIYLIHNLL